MDLNLARRFLCGRCFLCKPLALQLMSTGDRFFVSVRAIVRIAAIGQGHPLERPKPAQLCHSFGTRGFGNFVHMPDAPRDEPVAFHHRV
jgi:hypothetical protein